METHSSTSGDQLRDLGEEALLDRIIPFLPLSSQVVAGAGDDCAVVRTAGEDWQLLKTDCIIEQVHFSPSDDPELVGRKALNRAYSDIAAMGGKPDHALVTIACDESRPVREVEAWYRGLEAVARQWGGTVVGGETAKLPYPGAVISIALTGHVAPVHCVFRSGAQPGDLILVTGRLGGSFPSGRHLSFTPRLRESRFLVTTHKPTSMMDLSDGLGSDLPRLAAASGTGFTLDVARLPCHPGCHTDQAISDGEDYELLFTLPPAMAPSLMSAWKEHFPLLDLTVIGTITSESSSPLPSGWQHFTSPPTSSPS